jgi:hypothetical protein
MVKKYLEIALVAVVAIAVVNRVAAASTLVYGK